MIEKLEEDLEVPVVTESQAATWAALRKAQVMEPIRGYGKLMLL